MIKPSIFKRLFVAVSGLLMLLFGLSAVLVYYNISAQLNSSKDAELVSSSHDLWDSIKNDSGTNYSIDNATSKPLPEARNAFRQTLSPDSQWRTLRVWKNHTLIFQSGNSDFKDTPEAKPNFSEQKHGNDIWRTYAFYVHEENVIIEVSENLLSRKLLIQSIFKGFLESSCMLAPLLALLLFFSLRQGLKGLTHMEESLAARGPQSLEHMDIVALPKELQPLQRAINFLLGKLHTSLLHERQLIDNAAHELRTPLTTLKLHAQLAAGAGNDKEREDSMNDMLATIDRTAQLVEQLLALSRIATEEAERTQVCLHAVAAEVLAEHAAAAAGKEIELRLDGDEKAESCTNASLLRILLGILLDNAIKYTPVKGNIKISVAQDSIEIADTGPGIAQKEREKVFERFWRGKHEIQGNGLGLAIARQICDLLGIRIELTDAPEGHGLLVRLFLPARL